MTMALWNTQVMLSLRECVETRKTRRLEEAFNKERHSKKGSELNHGTQSCIVVRHGLHSIVIAYESERFAAAAWLKTLTLIAP